jgi:hypothetical protein
MNDAPQADISTLTVPGTPFGGGFFAGSISINCTAYALIVVPKDRGERTGVIWHKGIEKYIGAGSYYDGLANTQAMANAGSALGRWALDLRLGGHNDWYLPALDELEIIYRALKPTVEKNYCWARSGINLNAIPPTPPYTPDLPAQTTAPAFRGEGSEAFTEGWYWSSTQHAAHPHSAWCQRFSNGYQDYYYVTSKLRARAVRRVAI